MLSDARAAGLLDGEPPDFGDPAIAGASTTVVTVQASGDERRIPVFALDSDVDDELSGEQRDARARVREFVASLDGDTADAAYTATAVAVLVRPSDADGSDDSPPPEERAWPLGDLATAGEPLEDSPDIRCLAVTGPDAATVLDAAEDARENTRWTSAGAEYSLVFRPLLPDETTCDDLAESGTR
jgi:hypothetical protein